MKIVPLCIMSAADLKIASSFSTIDPQGMSWRGTWGGVGLYRYGDTVEYTPSGGQSGSYVCTATSGVAGVAPDAVGAPWELLGGGGGGPGPGAGVSSLADDSGAPLVTGAVQLGAGAGISVVTTGQKITISSTGGAAGVSSVQAGGAGAPISGAAIFAGTNGISVTEAGQTITIDGSAAGGVLTMGTSGAMQQKLTMTGTGTNPYTGAVSLAETAGREMMNYRGNWDIGTAYVTGDVVNGDLSDKLYVALQASTNAAPSATPASWKPFTTSSSVASTVIIGAGPSAAKYDQSNVADIAGAGTFYQGAAGGQWKAAGAGAPVAQLAADKSYQITMNNVTLTPPTTAGSFANFWICWADGLTGPPVDETQGYFVGQVSNGTAPVTVPTISITAVVPTAAKLTWLATCSAASDLAGAHLSINANITTTNQGGALPPGQSGYYAFTALA